MRGKQSHAKDMNKPIIFLRMETVTAIVDIHKNLRLHSESIFIRIEEVKRKEDSYSQSLYL